MVNTALQSDASLPDLLAARAHGASTRRLTIDVAGGLAVAAAAGLWRPFGWIALLGAGLCFATFGAWGLADRAVLAHHILDRGPAVTALKLARRVLAVLGALAAAVTAFGVLAIAMGSWIS